MSLSSTNSVVEPGWRERAGERREPERDRQSDSTALGSRRVAWCSRKLTQTPEPFRLPAAVWINPPAKMGQNSIDGPNSKKTSRVFDPQAICSTAPDALEGPESNCSDEIQSIATLNSIVQLSQNR